MSFFRDDEFMCKCGCGLDIDKDFKRLIAEAREIAGIPFIVTSAARCKEHNADIGSKSTSSHVAGLAVDIACSDSRSRSIIELAFCKLGVNRKGISETFLHFDVDTQKDRDVTWLYK